MAPRHLISPLDFSVEELEKLMDLAEDMKNNRTKYAHVCDDKRIATLFYEPSTRTRLSFEAAMMNLGGKVLGFHSEDSSPVINAGDGGHQHPTQTLTDLLTIRSLKGRFNGLTYGLCGDLKFGRTVHSLIEALSRYENVRFVLISPEELRVPSYIREEMRSKNIPFEEVVRLDESTMKDLDILYMTRVQKERFFNEEDYVRMKDFYILDKEKMKIAPKKMLILHPLPRVNEIAVEVDEDPRAAYFAQANYGVYIRMALIYTLLGIGGEA